MRYFSLAQRIQGGNLFTALIILVIILVFYTASRSISSNLNAHIEFSRHTQDTLAFTASMIELQRQALLYTYEGFEESADQVAELSQTMRGQLAAYSQLEDDQVAEIFARIAGHLETYGNTFQQVKNQRQRQKRLVRQQLREYATGAQRLIEKMQAAVAGDNPGLRLRYAELLNSILLVEKFVYRYFDSLDARYIDQALASIEESKARARQLGEIGTVNRSLLGSLEKVLDLYERKFLEAIQRTRGYLYLVNVVMAAEAYEILYQLKKLSEVTQVHADQIRSELLNATGQTINQVVLISVLLLAIAMIFYRLVSNSITRPLDRLSRAFRALSSGAEDARLPDYMAKDELGELTLAARSFESANRQLVQGRSDLLESNAEIRRINDNLEQTILDRTQEIFQQNLELEESRKKADAASLAKSQFLANMSHELRTPMNGVIGMSHLAMAACRDERVRGQIRKIENSANRLLSIINDILDFSKIEAGKFKLMDAPFDLYETVAEVMDLIRPDARNKQLELRVDYADTVGRHFRGDSLRLARILTNLLANAVKFTDAGGVSLRVQKIRQHRYLFQVCDSGQGIEEQQQQRLFEAFTQSDESDTRKHGGTGLGLSIARQLVELMNGRIWVKSAKGKGACFLFEVDMRETQLLVEEAKDNKRQDALSALKLELTTRAGSRVLLADDEEINHDVVHGLLEGTGICLTCVGNGRAAMEAFVDAGGAFDLVLLDVQMPVVDGVEAGRQIRAVKTDVPIVALTADLTSKTRYRVQAAGMDGLLFKPVNVEGFYLTLLKHLLPRQAAVPIQVPPAEGRFSSQDSGQHLDAKAGIRQIGGNPELYAKLLRTFAAQYRHTVLASLAPEALQQTLHRLRGTSANLGAKPLQKWAQLAERKPTPAALSQLQAALAAVVEEIDSIDSSPVKPPSAKDPIAPDRLQRLVLRLRAALEKMQADEYRLVMKELLAHDLDATTEGVLAEIRFHADHYDYEKALSILESHVR